MLSPSYVVTNKDVACLESTNGHDLRLLKLSEEGLLITEFPPKQASSDRCVLDVPGIGIRTYIFICLSHRRWYRNVFMQDNPIRYNLSRLWFLVSMKPSLFPIFSSLVGVARGCIRVLFLSVLAKKIGFVCDADAKWCFNGQVVLNGSPSAERKSLSIASESFVFWGNLDYQPNKESIIFFLENKWFGIKQKLPEATLTIAGVISDRTNEALNLIILAKGLEGIVIEKKFDDLATLTEGKTFLNLVMYGSGIKNKTLEAVAMGVPQIATEHALVGVSRSKGLGKFWYFVKNPRNFREYIVEPSDISVGLTWHASCINYIGVFEL